MGNAASAVKLARFLADIGPDLLRLGKSLFVVTGGDAVRARAALTVAREHGAELDRARDEVDHDLAQLRARKGQA